MITEEIYLRMFKYNLLQESAEKLKTNFLHAMTTDFIHIAIAREYIETDLLRTFEHLSVYRSITYWQIITIISTLIIANCGGLGLHAQECQAEMKFGQEVLFG